MRVDGRALLCALSAVVLTAGGVGSASIGHAKRGWKNGAVRTCWTADVARFKREVETLVIQSNRADLPTEEQRREVREWLDGAYSRERTGFEVDGLENCRDGEKVDALLLYNADLNSVDPRTGAAQSGVRGLGTPGNFSATGSLVNRITSLVGRRAIESGVAFNQDGLNLDIREIQDRMKNGIPHRLDPQGKLRKDLPEIVARYSAGVASDIRHWATLHEFGHLAGLLHEERRKDAVGAQPAFCGAGAGDALAEGTDSNRESRFGTEFDPFSVMNYCRKKMQILYRQALLVCEIGEDLKAGFAYVNGKVPSTLEPLLENCEFVRTTPFPVDLSPRDVAGLRNLYLKEVPSGIAKDYRESATERKWLEVFTQTDRLYL